MAIITKLIHGKKYQYQVSSYRDSATGKIKTKWKILGRLTDEGELVPSKRKRHDEAKKSNSNVNVKVDDVDERIDETRLDGEKSVFSPVKEEKKYEIKFENREIKSMAEIKRLMPYRPQCTNNFRDGVKRVSRRTALTKKYIELNPPNLCAFITFDLDYATDPFDYETYGLPAPLFYVRNNGTCRAHVIYGLSHPVFMSENAREKPKSLLKAIKKEYAEKFKADTCYVGKFSKNPFSKEWGRMQLSTTLYSLDYLASFVSLPDTRKEREKKKTENDELIASRGRNCDLFVRVKNWAYYAIKNFWAKGSSAWFSAIMAKLEAENGNIYADRPLPAMELKDIARSIQNWTWRNFTPEKFSEIQKKRRARRTLKYSRKGEGLELLAGGYSTGEIAARLNVSQRTVQRWKKERENKQAA